MGCPAPHRFSPRSCLSSVSPDGAPSLSPLVPSSSPLLTTLLFFSRATSIRHSKTEWAPTSASPAMSEQQLALYTNSTCGRNSDIHNAHKVLKPWSRRQCSSSDWHPNDCEYVALVDAFQPSINYPSRMAPFPSNKSTLAPQGQISISLGRACLTPHHTTPHHTTPHHTTPLHTTPHHTTPHHTTPLHTTPHHTTAHHTKPPHATPHQTTPHHNSPQTPRHTSTKAAVNTTATP